MALISGLGGLSAYLYVLWHVSYKKSGKGIITKFLSKTIPPKRWWVKGAVIYRYMLLWFTSEVLFISGLITGVECNLLLFGLSIIMCIDDIINGDDDERKRRWEGVKNKIKWKMELPQLAPAHPGTA